LSRNHPFGDWDTASPRSPISLETENPKEQSLPKEFNPTKLQNADPFLKKLKPDTILDFTSLDQRQKTVLEETIHT
jgi:hypothetical protein